MDLGYEHYEGWESAESWKLGDAYIVFVQVVHDFADIPYDRRRVGMNHLAFIQAAVTMWIARKRGQKARLPAPLPGSVSDGRVLRHLFEDPDGIKVEAIAEGK